MRGHCLSRAAGAAGTSQEVEVARKVLRRHVAALLKDRPELPGREVLQGYLKLWMEKLPQEF